MKIRFGYVAMSVHIANCSPSKTMTATHFQTITDREAAVRKLERIAAENIHNTLRLLRHNKAEGVKLYRLSSKLIPLLTHELLAGWNPLDTLEPNFRELGDYAKANGMRLSFHPDHFTVLSTPRQDVLDKSRKDLDWHVSMLERMGLDDRYKCNIHIGGTYGDKEKAASRFLRSFEALPERISRRITLENDDKTFTARETLLTCQKAGVPMVLDIHHHLVNNEGEDAAELWADIQSTWALGKASGDEADSLLTPKIHVSSPKSDANPRAHADYVDVDAFLSFARSIASQTPRLDVMIEAKKKDEALFRLVQEAARQPGVKLIDKAEIEI